MVAAGLWVPLFGGESRGLNKTFWIPNQVGNDKKRVYLTDNNIKKLTLHIKSIIFSKEIAGVAQW